FTLVVLLLTLAGIVFAAVKLKDLFIEPATTAIVEGSSLGNYYDGKLVIARNETLVSTENKTRIDFVAEEGSRVTNSSVICKVYSSGYNQTEINRLQTYREEIQTYHANQVLNTYVDAALDSENATIDALAQQVRTLVHGRGVGSLSSIEKQLESALSSRKNYLRQKYPDDQELSQLYKVENDQLKKIESWTTTYTAEEDCLVSFYTDGYEEVVNSRTYANLTPADVRNVVRGVAPDLDTVSKGNDPIFRTIIEDEWYALFLCTNPDWNPVVGEKYQMQLTGFDHWILQGEVMSFSRIGNDLLLRMRVNSDVEPVLNIRTCDATVGDFVSGVRVPVGALYNYVDPNTKKESIGVIVLDGSQQTFVEVIVISYPDERTAFVRPMLSGSPLEAGKTVMLF
ncbi:MAG: hypothetical protein IJ381_07040, partial [Clostridia bacterium]|nr:hypothetical protein [Clostridia bacterium]